MSRYDIFTRDMMPEIHRVSTLPHCEGKGNMDNDARKRACSAARQAQMLKGLKTGNQLRKYRVENNMSIVDVAAIVKCGFPYLTKIERRTGEFTRAQKARLYAYYGNLVECEMVVGG